MNEIIRTQLKNYKTKSLEDEKQALRDLLQKITLLALWRSKFFEHAVFYGGTALRILYELDRYSEDLDFTLIKPDKKFSLHAYSQAIEEELMSYGFSVSVKIKEKATSIASAFVKTNTMQHLIKISSSHRTHKEEVLTVKLEIDTDPALGFNTENMQLFWPLLHSVTSCDLPSLFAGKIHAILCRERVINIKGRDWYDFLWYIARTVPFNIIYLENKLRQSQFLNKNSKLTLDEVKIFLHDKINLTDLEAAKQDIKPFIADTRRLDAWSKEAFHAAVEKLHV